MSAVQAIEPSPDFIDVLKAPYDTWSSQEVLSYFQSRSNIRYFAVANDAEVAREKIDQLLMDRFSFNEETFMLPKLDWLTNPSPDIEWAIMLHKFYYAVGLGIAYKETGNDSYAKKWIELTSSWIAHVPVDFLSSDVTGRRIQNWIFAHYYFVTECRAESVTPEFYRKYLTSIHEQASYLRNNLTPARNHRTLELYTLFLVAVVFPELKEADHWLRFTIDELLKNAQSDLLDDGVHCELSTDYHHIVLRNFLAVKRLAVMNDVQLPSKLDECIKKALVFSVYVHKPDGTIPSLSDGDTGSFLPLLQQGYEFYGCEEMLYVASQGKAGVPPSYRSKAFPSGGYYILRSGWGDDLDCYQDERYLVFDCGDLGAGNHGHLDLLSFEMAAYGQSLIVDPGRYTYDESGDTNWRILFRGTSYHNTVLVDGKNQARYEFHKEKFKIKGPQPDHELKAFISRPGFDYLHGVAKSHEYPVVHERKILFVNGEYWIICDVLRADDTHNYELLFHLAASAQDKVSLNTTQHCLSVDAPHLVMLQPTHKPISVSVENAYVSPTYGVKQEAPVVKFNQQGTECCFYTVLYPYKKARPVLTVSSIPVFKNQEICRPFAANCLSIISETEEHVFRDFVFVANEPGSYQTGHHTIKSLIFFQREDEQGNLHSQFDYDAPNIYSFNL
jgi:Heparinase II/III N-terminus/Heparinase II/III-like protein